MSLFRQSKSILTWGIFLLFACPIFATTTYVKTLDNGLKVIVGEKPGSPVAAVQIWYNVGSREETNGIKGIAHLFEHMMFRGSKNYPSEAHFNVVQSLGGDANAFTSDDMTVYHETVPATAVPTIFKLEADRMANLILNQDILDTERQVVLEEYRWRYESNPHGALFYKIRQSLYPDHPYMYGAIGTKTDIENYTVTQCQSFYDTYYEPNNATLVVVGAVNHDDIFKEAETYFGPIPAKPLPDRVALPFPEQPSQSITLTSMLPLPQLIMASYTPPASDNDSYALEVLLEILTGGDSSLLNQELVIKKEWAQSVSGDLSTHKGPGALYIAITHPEGTSENIKNAINETLTDLAESPVDIETLDRAKNRLLKSHIFSQYSASDVAQQLGYCDLVLGDHLLFEAYPNAIKDVSREDIMRVCNTWLSPEKRIFITVLAKTEPSERPVDETH